MTDTNSTSNTPAPTAGATQGQSNTPSTLEYGRAFKLTIGKPGNPGTPATPAATTLTVNGTVFPVTNGNVQLSASQYQALPTTAVGYEGVTSNADGTFTLTGVTGDTAPAASAVAPTQGQAIDLSQMRVVFKVTKNSTSSPNVCLLRVYNLSKATTRLIQREFTQVILQAGYTGNIAQIFIGTVIRMSRGKNVNLSPDQAQPSILTQRENQTDTYLEIVATDGDVAHNFATVHVSLAAGATLQNKLDAIKSAVAPYNIQFAASPTFTQGTSVLPRGQVLHGQFRDIMDDFCASTGSTWSIQDGTVELILKDSVIAGNLVVLSPTTGLLSMPKETINGIEMTCLLNPALKAGRVVQLKTPVNQTQPGSGFTDLDIVNPLDPEGLYRVFYFEHSGDTRGNPWYTNIIALGLTSEGPNPGSNSLNYYGV
jgi:hypothetical protein